MSGVENPAAFPLALPAGYEFAENGMTLRDWFAGQAPVTLFDAAVTCGWDSIESANMPKDDYRATLFAVLTLLRYEYADAMLAERAKGGAA